MAWSFWFVRMAVAQDDHGKKKRKNLGNELAILLTQSLELNRDINGRSEIRDIYIELLTLNKVKIHLFQIFIAKGIVLFMKKKREEQHCTYTIAYR